MQEKLEKYLYNSRKRYLNEKDDDGWSPLHLASRGGHLSVVEMIFDKAQELTIDLNATDNGMLTSFHWVCLEGYFEVAKLFVEKSHELKIDLNVKDSEMEWTPFHYACYEARTDIVELMLENSESQTIYIRCDLYDHFSRTGRFFQYLNFLVYILVLVEGRGREVHLFTLKKMLVCFQKMQI